MGSTLRMVYLAISAYADANGYAEPSLAEICDLAEVNSHNTVVAAARELEELGRLTIIHRHATDGAKLSNGYQLTGLEGVPGSQGPRTRRAHSPLQVAHILVARESAQDAAREREEGPASSDLRVGGAERTAGRGERPAPARRTPPLRHSVTMGGSTRGPKTALKTLKQLQIRATPPYVTQ